MRISEKIGGRIKEAREAKGWTLRDLASATNGALSASRIGNWEQGTRRPKSEEAILLGKALGRSAAWILCVDSESTLTKDEQAILDLYRATDERGRATVFRVAESQPDVKQPDQKGRKSG